MASDGGREVRHPLGVVIREGRLGVDDPGECGGDVVEPRAATEAEIARVHAREYIGSVRETSGRSLVRLTMASVSGSSTSSS